MSQAAYHIDISMAAGGRDGVTEEKPVTTVQDCCSTFVYLHSCADGKVPRKVVESFGP